MASPAARRLTEAHRVAQARLGAETVAQMHTLWAILDPNRLDQTFDQWLLAALPVIRAQHLASSQLAGGYLAMFKKIEMGIGARLTPVAPVPVDVRRVTASLLVTGPVSIKRAMSRGVLLDQAARVAEATSAAAAMRQALDGGREIITATLAKDPDATGWARVASSHACAFCDELDGQVFSADTADFPAHDGCACSAEPVFA